jgi:hypothetical protein
VLRLALEYFVKRTCGRREDLARAANALVGCGRGSARLGTRETRLAEVLLARIAHFLQIQSFQNRNRNPLGPRVGYLSLENRKV